MIKRARVPKSTDVKVTFTLPTDEPPGPVSVVGDFNDWTPGALPFVKRAGGQRSASLTLPAGTTVRFRYLGTDGHWFDDPDADGADHEASWISV